MDPIELLQWFEDDDEIISSLQVTTALILKIQTQRKHGGSQVGRKTINRNQLQAHVQLYKNYFSENPTYLDKLFCQRFRMQRSLFLKIVDAIAKEDEYFVQKRDAAGQLGFAPLQKGTAAMRILAYGYSADSIDEYL
jgi:hypothetical protein